MSHSLVTESYRRSLCPGATLKLRCTASGLRLSLVLAKSEILNMDEAFEQNDPPLIDRDHS